MTKKKAGILSLLLFTIVAILHILHEYVTPISSAVLMWSRWIFIASLFIWGWFKKSLTTWIMIAMAMGNNCCAITIFHFSGWYCQP